MDNFNGILNDKGLSSFNQSMFTNMAYFSDAVWVIDVKAEKVEIIHDNVEPESVGKIFTLEEIRNRIKKHYSKDIDVMDKYTVEYMRNLKETEHFRHPSFVVNEQAYNLRNVITPEIGEDGEVCRVYLTSMNATKVPNLDENESRALLEHFVKAYASAYMVNLKERSFEILHMNHEFKNVFVMDGNMEDMKNFVANHVHPEDRAHVYQMIDPDYVSRRLKTETEITFTLREQYQGKERTMHAMIMKGIDEYHAAVGFMDVSNEIQKEKEIQRKLEAANNAKKDFLSAMSHDIRTPMNAIVGMADIALNNTDNMDKVVDSLNKIRMSGNQLTTLVNDVLDISAIESGKTELRPVPHSVEAGSRELESIIQGLLNGKDLDIEVIDHDIIHPWIMIDEVRLNQILNNLLSNAVKYTPEGGRITIEIWQDNDEQGKPWENIVVSDTGIGMNPEFIEKMWDAFSRATDTRINKIGGAGLGLSIVKSLVEMMDGTITVESELNKGSTFTCRIPVIPAKPCEVEAEAIVADQGQFTCNVLVAEDNEMNWEIANELLSMNGVTCIRAENGKIAVDKFLSSKQGVYDAILMDMQMPIMDGIDATVAIRASKHPQAKEIPIIAMTANAFNEDVKQCLEAGMNEHISKPIEVDKVMVALRKFTIK
ncbi:MAG: response regulator [Firmicutes bacterium]|nr:response regulator [Bacillota bacterium]